MQNYVTRPPPGWGGCLARLTNNVVADNQANAAGSGLYIKGSIPCLLHTTIARNGGGDGSGVYVTDAYGGYSTVALTNTILVGHTVGITVTADSTATLEATLLGSGAWANKDDYGGEGCITGGFYNNIKGLEYSIATLNAVSGEAAAEPFIVDDRWSISHGNLPLGLGSYASAPDLVVERIIATSNAVTVTIKNQGNAPVADAFCPGRSTGVRRCFDIDVAAALDTPVRFYYSEGERNCLALDSLHVFHYSDGWTEEPGPYTRGGTGEAQYVQVQDVAVSEQSSLFALDSLDGGGCLPMYLPLVVKK